MHPSYRQYGLSEDDAPYVAAFESWAKRQGWSRDRIESAYIWYANQKPGLGEHALVESFSQFAAAQGWPLDQRDAAFAWHSHVADHGADIYRQNAPSHSSDVRRAEEIQRIMRDEPQRYYRDEDLQREYYDILERREAAAAPKTPPIATQKDAARRHEIETIMHGQDGRRYWQNEGMQREYSAIVERAESDASRPDGGGTNVVNVSSCDPQKP